MAESINSLGLFLQNCRMELRRAAEADIDLPPLTEELFGQFERTGDRLGYEAAYFARRKCLTILGLQAVMDWRENHAVPKERLERLSAVIEDVCGETCWALPAHVDRTNDPDWPHTVDLFAAETAQTLAELADRLGPVLPHDLRALAVEQVERRVLAPFLSTPAPYGAWEGGADNWNAVCAGCIGSASLHLLRGQPDRLRYCLERVCASLLRNVEGLYGDGACLEGVTYYTYGMTYFVNFALELYEHTGGRTDLLRGSWGGFSAGWDDLRARIARFLPKCFFPDGRSVSFSDSTSRETFRVGLNCALALRYPGVGWPSLDRAAGPHSDRCYRFAALKMDLLCTEEYLARDGGFDPPCGEGGPRFHILPAAQWCVGHSASGAGFACKGGDNGAPHNHNDIGHFIYEAGGVMLLTDLGLEEYTRDYFGPKRYERISCASLGHSVPVVGGLGQGAGAEYRCGSFSAGEDGTVELELHDAYPAGLLERFERNLSFDMETGELRVRDRLCLSHGGTGPILERLITQIPPELTKDGIVLKSGSAMAVIKINEPSWPEITVETYSRRSHLGRTEPVYAIQWEAPIQDRTAESNFCVNCQRN